MLLDVSQKMIETKQSDSLNWKDVERDLICRVLEKKNGNQAQALKVLGYGSINTLKEKIKRYNIDI